MVVFSKNHKNISFGSRVKNNAYFAYLCSVKHTNIMKKILTILSIAVMAISVVSCERDDETQQDSNEVRKLPSRITTNPLRGGRPDFYWSHSFWYDAQNRLTKIVSENATPGVLHIFYNSDNTLEKLEKVLENGRTTTVTFEHNSNQVIVTSVNPHYQGSFYSIGNWVDTLWLNENQQVVQINSYMFLEYDSNGNFVRFRRTGENSTESELFYTNIPAVWRHANIPAWFFKIRLTWFSVMHPFTSTKGYMVKKEIAPNWKSEYSYTLDDDGYPKTTTIDRLENPRIFTLTIEYILAN